MHKIKREKKRNRKSIGKKIDVKRVRDKRSIGTKEWSDHLSHL